jgi:hypothetical protein
MPQFIGEKKVVLGSIGNPVEHSQTAPASKPLDPALKRKLAEFALFLDDIEDCTQTLRVDQLEQLIAQAVATCGFESPSEARATLEWMFHQSIELS